MININNETILVGKDYVYLISDKGLIELRNVESLKQRSKSSRINLITSHDLAHFHIIDFPEKEKVTKEKIKNELQKLVPTDLDKTTWSYQSLTDSNRNDEIKPYWAFATEDNLLRPFIKALQNNDITVGDVSFLPWLINKQVIKTNAPTLLIFIRKKIKFIALIDDEKIYPYDLGNLENFKQDIADLLEYGKKELGLKVQEIIAVSDRDLSKLKLKLKTEDFKFKNLKFRELIEDYKIDTHTSITSPKIEEPFKPFEKTEKEETAEVVKSNLPLLLALLGASLIFMSVIVGPKIFGERQPRSTKPPEIDQYTQSTSELIKGPSPSPEERFYAELYSIEVLNGTRQGGIASEVKELLEENGFVDVAIGNALERDYQLTEIHTDNDPALVEYIREIIGNDYQISTEETRGSLSGDFDATIILGNKN